MDLVSQDELDRDNVLRSMNNANLRLNELLKQVEVLEQKIQLKR